MSSNIDDVLGDARVLEVYSLDGDSVSHLIGKGWQDQAGNLHGTGLIAVMLFEPECRVRYRQAAHAQDLSPLNILYNRICTNLLYRVRLVSEKANP